jgi:hypothetical protein
MNADGSIKRQITNCLDDCLDAVYLPSGGIAYTAIDRSACCETSYLAVCGSDGSGANRITFGFAGFRLETVLSDGRLLTSAPSPLTEGNGRSVGRRLYTLQPDGTALSSFRSADSRAGLISDGEELEDGSVVFVRNVDYTAIVAGQLSEIARRTTHEMSLGAPEFASWSPRRLAGGKLIVARWIAGTQSLSGRFDLYSFDLVTRGLGERVYGDPTLSSVQGVPVVPRPRPRRLWSTVSSQTNAAGYFVCLDSRISAEEPVPRSPATARVRVLTRQTERSHELVLGDAPVESDGSFYVAIPADRPVRFELLDLNGHVVKAQKSWIWARPGEQRGCVGCHDDASHAPDNRWPLTLRRLDTPTQLGVRISVPVAP